MKRVWRKGFTLIELLIVIAIILILIAIALPNFLEAQVRARVVNAKGALRTIQTALESYALDNPTYKPRFPDPDPAQRHRWGPYPPYGGGWRGPRFMVCNTNYDAGCLNVLSTPIQYLQAGSHTVDIFQSALNVQTNDDTKRRPFGYYSPGVRGVAGKFRTYVLKNPGSRDYSLFADYWVYSVGPDQCSNADGDFRTCWDAPFKADPILSVDGAYWVYSPTNGTKSGGDLHLLHTLGVVN